MAITFLMTSCGKEDIVTNDDLTEMNAQFDSNVQDNEAVLLIEDLPVNSEAVLSANKKTKLKDSEEQNRKYCSNKGIISLTCDKAEFRTNAQYDLWLFYYDENDEYITHSRQDVNACATWTLTGYYKPSGTHRVEAFVGYRSWGVLNVYCSGPIQIDDM